MANFPYGAVLKIQREHSVGHIRDSMDRMKALGMNFAVVWPAVYWWEDRTDPRYPYRTGHEILAYAQDIGMQIIMELAGQIPCLEYAPDFLMKEEYYAVTREGGKAPQGMAYDVINYNHPEVKALIAKQYKEIATHYKDYSSLYGYDIWNETMFTSFDRHTLQRFREWLERKYGDIGALNDAWDRTYADWSQVEFTNWLWASVMPKVDYEQFHKDNIGLILHEWRAAIRIVDDVHPTIADNVHSMIAQDPSYNAPHDDWAVAANVDEFGISFYPKNDILGNPAMEPFVRWQILNGAHAAARDGRFWISELQSHHQAMFNPFTYVYPHELRWWGWEAVAHGARGIVYWKWDPFVKGVQTFGRGLVDSEGNYTDRAHEAAATGRILGAIGADLAACEPERPKTAILYDRLNHDFVKAFTLYFEPHTPSRIYTDSIAGLYECLWERNISVDFVTPEQVASGSVSMYNVLFVTNQVCMTDSLAAGLRRFAAGGGTVIADGKFGEVNEGGLLYGRIPGAALDEATGFALTDMEPASGHAMELRRSGSGGGGRLKLHAYYERRHMRLIGGEVETLAEYDDGKPAIVVNNCGQGRFVYVSTMLWYGFSQTKDAAAIELIRLWDGQYGMSAHYVEDKRIKLRVLQGRNVALLFAFNYGSADIDTQVSFAVAEEGRRDITELYSGVRYSAESDSGYLTLPVAVKGLGVAVLRVQAVVVAQDVVSQDVVARAVV